MTDKEFEEGLPKHIDLHNRLNIYAGQGDLNILSNINSCEFFHQNKKWYSVEQAYLYYKALFLKNKRVARHIRETKDPWLCKDISKNIIKPDKILLNEWNRISKRIMKSLIRASLADDKKKRSLINTGNALLTHIPDKSNWRHDFPLILMQLREEIRK